MLRTGIAIGSLVLCCVMSQASTAAESEISKIAFGSCANQNEPQPLLDVAAAGKPDLFIYLGDNIYGDTNDMSVLREKYDVLAARPEFQRLRKSTKIIATWDDHDFGADDSGREYRHKEESKEIFLEFFDEPKQSPRRDHAGVYTSYEYGPENRRVQIILLDLRTFRAPLKRSGKRPTISHAGPYAPNTSEDAVLMGEDQWRWLKKQLKRPAKIRLIGSSVQFAAEFHGWEAWANFPNERRRFIDLIDETEASGVILLSGDMHYGEISVMTENVPYPLYDFTSSGINRVWEHPMQNIHRISDTEYRPHVGWIEINWETDDPEITLRLETLEGDSPVMRTILLTELSAR
ncbi:MAG TPA: alkaline phosphatase family protein [Candidatus Hydrogenedentes bacterium]|nr:alkaline phosphatase family protein [Candidatus Hydrogenedentota bacterium]